MNTEKMKLIRRNNELLSNLMQALEDYKKDLGERRSANIFKKIVRFVCGGDNDQLIDKDAIIKNCHLGEGLRFIDNKRIVEYLF